MEAVRKRSKSFFVGASREGLRTSSPPIIPTHTEPSGPSHGQSESAVARFAAFAAMTSCSCSKSYDSTPRLGAHGAVSENDGVSHLGDDRRVRLVREKSGTNDEGLVPKL